LQPTLKKQFDLRLETCPLIPFSLRSIPCAMALMLSLSACSSLSEKFSGDKVDYRNSSTKPSALEVPPDLTQLPNDTRYQPPSGVSVTASSFQSSASAPKTATTNTNTTAPNSVGDVRVERAGNSRWLSTTLTPEQLWPKLQSFWEERRLSLSADKPEVGIMETEWAENRAKLPLDILRKTLGKALDNLYSTGELDKFRLRLERTATGTEIYLLHRGFEEIYTGSAKESTIWQPRARDPQLEAEMLSLLMIKLGTKEQQAKAELAKPAPDAPPAKARALAQGPAAALQVDDNFERAWRKVGLALDRSGFTVEDRDRAQGIYFVRYVDPASAGQEEKGFLRKLFGSKDKTDNSVVRYRVNVKSEGENSTVSVLNANGEPENGDAGQRIVKLLVEELK
jgi:outer membrane protein assembly factor BamC